jgi:hypothetical protein
VNRPFYDPPSLDGSVLKRIMLTAGVLIALIAADVAGLVSTPFSAATAEARIGRPWTPASYAGVARRTTRRAIALSGIYVAALPPACVRVKVNGTTLWRCAGTYYQAYRGRYVVVYVN